MVKKACALKKEKGILPDISPKKAKKIVSRSKEEGHLISEGKREHVQK